MHARCFYEASVRQERLTEIERLKSIIKQLQRSSAVAPSALIPTSLHSVLRTSTANIGSIEEAQSLRSGRWA